MDRDDRMKLYRTICSHVFGGCHEPKCIIRYSGKPRQEAADAIWELIGHGVLFLDEGRKLKLAKDGKIPDLPRNNL
jgi:hypothetical protein